MGGWPVLDDPVATTDISIPPKLAKMSEAQVSATIPALIQFYAVLGQQIRCAALNEQHAPS